jgi:renal tumor antigen
MIDIEELKINLLLFSDKRTGVLCLIFELMNMNLYEYIRGRQRLLSNETVCKFMYQLLKALEYIHRYFI